MHVECTEPCGPLLVAELSQRLFCPNGQSRYCIMPHVATNASPTFREEELGQRQPRQDLLKFSAVSAGLVLEVCGLRGHWGRLCSKVGWKECALDAGALLILVWTGRVFSQVRGPNVSVSKYSGHQVGFRAKSSRPLSNAAV